MPLKPTTSHPIPDALAGAAPEPESSPKPTAKAKKKPQPLVLCPYCGEPTPVAARCGSCRGLLDALSRQASQNAMGPWFVHDSANPFRPGCSYETVVAMAKRGKIEPHTVLRGPTTQQFWCAATATPGVSHLFGVCYQCRADVQTTDHMCDDCGADFTIETDRQHLGLNPVEPLPGQAGPANESGVVSSAVSAKNPAPGTPGVADDDLNAAIAVLSRRLRNQTRLVNGLATSVIAMLVMLVGLGVWLAADRAARINLGNMIGGTPAAGDGALPGTARNPEQDASTANEPREADIGRTGEADPAAAPKAAPTPPVAAVPVVPPEPPVDPVEREIAELIAKDTAESLTRALTLLPVGNDASAPASGRRRAVELRLEQLRLRGLR